MNRTLTLSLSALAGVTAIGAADASSILGEPRVDLETAPGLRDIAVPAAHHESAIAGVVWYPSNADGADRIVAQNPLFHGVPASRDATSAASADGHPVVILSHGMGGLNRTVAWPQGSAMAAGQHWPQAGCRPITQGSCNTALITATPQATAMI